MRLLKTDTTSLFKIVKTLHFQYQYPLDENDRKLNVYNQIESDGRHLHRLLGRLRSRLGDDDHTDMARTHWRQQVSSLIRKTLTLIKEINEIRFMLYCSMVGDDGDQVSDYFLLER